MSNIGVTDSAASAAAAPEFVVDSEDLIPAVAPTHPIKMETEEKRLKAYRKSFPV